MKNKTVQVILDRVSCKSYSNKKVSTSKIQQIAECGKNAPSGMNRQICNITMTALTIYNAIRRYININDCHSTMT
jgi:nitroreductase